MYSILKFTLPFSNELANVLTISEEGPFTRLYKPCPHSWTELSSKTIIDVCALTGIVWNVSHVSNKYGYIKGIIYGCMLILLAFIIPNLSMEPIINMLCGHSETKNDECSHIKKLIVGLLYIFVLFILEIILSIVIKGKINKTIRTYF
jgi:hypothetical protein